jgi:hypothetical protein
MTRLVASAETIFRIYYICCTTFIFPFSSATFFIEHSTITNSARGYRHDKSLPSSSFKCLPEYIPGGHFHGQSHVLPMRFQRRDSNEQKSMAKADISSFTTSSTNSDKYQMEMMEKEVLASTQSKLDWKYVQDALFGKGQDNSQPNNVPTAFANDDDDNKNFNRETSLIFSSIEISLASSILFAALCFVVLHQPTVVVIVFSLVFLLANGNPLQEENAFGT